MYKILVKYPSDKITNIWKEYGSTTTSSTGETTFKEFETDDLDTLKQELVKLDKTIGSSNIRVVEDKTIEFTVDVSV